MLSLALPQTLLGRPEFIFLVSVFFSFVVNDLVVKSFCCWGVLYVVRYCVVDIMSLSRQVLQGPSSTVMICKK